MSLHKVSFCWSPQCGKNKQTEKLKTRFAVFFATNLPQLKHHRFWQTDSSDVQHLCYLHLWDFGHLAIFYKCPLLGTTVGFWTQVVKAKCSAFSINTHELLTSLTIISYAEGAEKFSRQVVARRDSRLRAVNKMRQFSSCNCNNESWFQQFGWSVRRSLEFCT